MPKKLLIHSRKQNIKCNIVTDCNVLLYSSYSVVLYSTSLSRIAYTSYHRSRQTQSQSQPTATTPPLQLLLSGRRKSCPEVEDLNSQRIFTILRILETC